MIYISIGHWRPESSVGLVAPRVYEIVLRNHANEAIAMSSQMKKGQWVREMGKGN